ncbi:MAG: pilus assembly protein TadG-related protein, partial [Novosphingobium sp.]
MLGTIRRFLSDLRHNKSGNAMLLVALGMPVLIGTSGLAVDSAQYYMWKRDLQYAADQSALAGAWARTTTATQSTYSSRALQEYNANVQNSADFDAAPTIALGNWDSATNAFTANANGTAVKVTASASKSLPFTNIVTGRPVTVSVSAIATASQAGNSVTTTTTYNTLTACMIALNPSASGAFTIGGSASGSVGCGGAALSSDPSAAIRENGNPSATFGQLVATGGIEYSLLNNVGGDPLKLKSNTVGLVDPLGVLATPTGNGITRTYSCPTVTAGSYTADGYTTTETQYAYYKGKQFKNATLQTSYTGTGFLADVTGTDAPKSNFTNAAATSTTAVGTGAWSAWTAGTETNANGGSDSSTIWRVPSTRTQKTITAVHTLIAANDGTAKPLPGTYSNISIACKTEFQPGIFVINGTIDFSQNQTVTGAGVLFVMTAANTINNINSNTNLAFSGITSSMLMSDYGYSSADAAKLAGMLFFDKLSTDQIKFNGNSTTNFNGIIYTPHRTLWFNGTSAVSGACMMLVADKLLLDGTTNMSSFCQPSNANSMQVRPQFTTSTTTPGTTAS